MDDLCRLYIDESGNHKYHNYENPKYNNVRDRYLALLGVFITRVEYSQVHDDLEALKKKNFHYDPDEPIVFHREDIIKKKGPFGLLCDQKKEIIFNEDLLDFLRNLKCTIILVVLDKMRYKDRYKNPFHPYHFALAIMLERYCGYLKLHNKMGDVMAEARGGNEDLKLKKEYRRLYEQGTGFHIPTDFQNTLTSKEIKIKSKERNISGIQIADILANPCKIGFLKEKRRIKYQEADFGRQVCEAIRDKYNKQVSTGQVDGYGKIFLE